MRKRFLESLKHPGNAEHVRRVLRHPAGAELQGAMREWLARGTVVVAGKREFPLPERVRPRCSVVINTVDRARDLAETLAALRPLWDAGRDELVIVLGPSADGSEEVIRGCGLPHRLVRCPERNLGQARNVGLAAAAGRYVAFLDDDASPEAGWLEELLAPMEGEGKTAVTAGFIMDGEGRSFLNRYVVADTLGRAWWCDEEVEARRKIEEVGSERAFLTASGCNMAFRRDALAGIGGFDEAYRYFLEETDVVWRLIQAGFGCAPARGSVVRHRLGANVARKPSFAMDERCVVIRSQIHYIGKFGRVSFADAKIENLLWERVLRDLEKLAWDCAEHGGKDRDAGDLQADYLRAVAGALRECGGLT